MWVEQGCFLRQKQSLPLKNLTEGASKGYSSRKPKK